MAEDRPIRRTWRLLFGAFVLLGAVTAGRAVTSGDALDWLPVVAVLIAALAAVLHRNAVANLEARGRAEAENFARILQGLSRSVSVDAIVGAIMDDLADGTGADHVVVVRRRPEGDALEATIVSRRPGVHSSSTVLPLSDLEAPPDRPPSAPLPIQVDVAAPVVAGAREPVMAGVRGTDRRPADADRAGSVGIGLSAGAWAAAARAAGTAWLAGLLDDLGVAHPLRSTGPLLSPRSEVLGTGPGAAVTARIADRVRSVYGLSHTLAAPLRTEAGVIGAIVLSRRDREDWPDAARRFLEGAAVEAAAALARAYSYREVATHASSDPLTGLPNRRYFDEFCGLLARRRRAGDAVAVLMVDIDKFKVLNDTFGHPVGDEVLKAVAGAIVAAVRDEDVPARVGGEEFAVLLRNPEPEVAVEVGERVRVAVRALDLRRHGVAGVTVSVGVANARGADESMGSIVDRADHALLRAKRAGRDRVIAG
jgi:diguanylate cyclase (GGDEF)-like protein